jgi:nucleotide-binding universal stress UspA family protein
MHVIDYPLSYRGPHLNTPHFIVTEAQIKKIGDHIMKKTLRGVDTKGIGIFTKTVAGRTADAISDEASRDGVDLIVLGSRGYNAMSGVLIGSTAQRVLTRANCDVMVVK